MMNGWKRYLIAALAGLGCSGALAQTTLGELLDAGAVKLTKQQVMETIIGGTVSAPEPGSAGRTWQTEFKADGNYSGNFQNPLASSPHSRIGSYFGKWTLGDDGKLCTEGRDFSNKETASCSFYFRLGQQLYVALKSDSDRSAAVHKRVVKR